MTMLSEMLESFRNGRIRRAAIRDLKRLPAAQLRDMGIAPDQFGDIVDAMLDAGHRRASAPRLAPQAIQFPGNVQTATAGCG